MDPLDDIDFLFEWQEFIDEQQQNDLDNLMQSTDEYEEWYNTDYQQRLRDMQK